MTGRERLGESDRLWRLAEAVHAMTYYTPEILRLNEEGYKGWWHAYFGYRPSPMGAVGPAVVTSVFYNFAPRMVERALPGVWQVNPPEATGARRLELVDAALRRSLADDVSSSSIVAAANLARRGVEGCNTAGRPLFGAYASLDWPTEPHLALWHACTLLRELRGDSHHIALASADVDGVQCHVLMAARGHGNMKTILGIRGWNEEEWATAVDSLASRGWVSADGDLTGDGLEQRSAIERHTDELAREPLQRLGDDHLGELDAALTPLVDHLVESGEVSTTWPPPSVMKT